VEPVHLSDWRNLNAVLQQDVSNIIAVKSRRWDLRNIACICYRSSHSSTTVLSALSYRRHNAMKRYSDHPASRTTETCDLPPTSSPQIFICETSLATPPIKLLTECVLSGRLESVWTYCGKYSCNSSPVATSALTYKHDNVVDCCRPFVVVVVGRVHGERSECF
jgi:hypothetical protein